MVGWAALVNCGVVRGCRTFPPLHFPGRLVVIGFYLGGYIDRLVGFVSSCRRTTGDQTFAGHPDRYQLPSGVWMLVVWDK